MPRKTAKERESVGAGEAALYGKGFVNVPSKWDTRVQHSDAPTYDMDAAARVAYEAFIRQLGLKVGEKVSDASGVHRIPAWSDHKTFVKARWRTVAQAVIDAATGVQRKQLDLTSAPNVKGSADDVAEYLHNRRQESGRSNEQDIQVRGRQRNKRPARATPRRAQRTAASRRVDAKRS
jgi:hypothetical protein